VSETVPLAIGDLRRAVFDGALRCSAPDPGDSRCVGRVYQQTLIDTYAKVAFAKLYDRKTSITAAEILNDRVVPFYDEHGIPLSRMLTDRGTEFCGTQSHEYER
jgi:hypothetical protein